MKYFATAKSIAAKLSKIKLYDNKMVKLDNNLSSLLSRTIQLTNNNKKIAGKVGAIFLNVVASGALHSDIYINILQS